MNYENVLGSKKMNRGFEVASVCRLDVYHKLVEDGMSSEKALEKASKLSDSEMAHLAGKIADTSLETGVYWEAILQWIEYYKR